MKKLLLVLGLVTGIVINAQSTPKDSIHHHHPTFKSEFKDYWKRIKTPGNSDYNVFWSGVGLGVGYWLVDLFTLDNIKNGGFIIYNGQCSAIAISTGQRCKRSSQSGSTRCWQHL